METQNLAKWISELQAQIDQVKRIAQAAGGGDEVTITPALESGTKIADYAIGEEEGVLYAPTPYTPPAYSATEFDTGKKWTDGRAIYGVVIADTISAAADGKVIHTNTDIDLLIRCDAMIYGSGYELALPYLLGTTQAAYVVFNRIAGTLVRYQSANFVSDYPDCLAYIEYVKKAPEPENSTKKRRK